MAKGVREELTAIKKDIEYLLGEMQQGFKVTHRKQNETNGRVLKNEKDIQHLSDTVVLKDLYNDDKRSSILNQQKNIRVLLWDVLKIALGAGLAIAGFLLQQIFF